LANTQIHLADTNGAFFRRGLMFSSVDYSPSTYHRVRNHNSWRKGEIAVLPGLAPIHPCDGWVPTGPVLEEKITASMNRLLTGRRTEGFERPNAQRQDQGPTKAIFIANFLQSRITGMPPWKPQNKIARIKTIGEAASPRQEDYRIPSASINSSAKEFLGKPRPPLVR